MNLRLLPALSLLLATACGDSGLSTSQLPVDDIARIQCRQLLQCDLGNDALEAAVFRTEAECQALFAAAFSADATLQAYLDAGRVKLDRTAFARCLDAIDASPCVPPDEIPACDDITRGTVADGGGCVIDEECVSGVCSGNSNACGSCVALVAVGAACDPDLDNCQQQPTGRVTCDTTGAGPTCVFHESAYLQVGLNESCNNQNGVERFCGPDLYCNTDEVCTARLPAGTLCDPDLDECVRSTTCADDGNDFRCLTTVLVTAAGQPCNELASGAFGLCDRRENLYCDRDSDTCLLLGTTGAENTLCDTNADCDAGLVCAVSDGPSRPGTCERTNKVDGTACSVDAECASGSCRYSAAVGDDVCTALVECP